MSTFGAQLGQQSLSDTSNELNNCSANESNKRQLNSNESFGKKRFRDNEDIDFDQNLDNYYTNSSNGVNASNAEEEWDDKWEFTEFDRMLMSVSNQLINFSINMIPIPDEWPDYEPNADNIEDKPVVRPKDDGFPPKLGQTLFGYCLDQLVCVDKRSAVFVGHKLKDKSAEELIIKVGIESGFNSLQTECNNYIKLRGLKSVPNLLDFIWWRVYSDNCSSVRWGLIVIEKFGSNIAELMRRSERGVIEPMERLFGLAVEMIDVLEDIHGMGFIHSSLKVENFVFESDDNSQLKAIGLSSAKTFMNQKSDGSVEHIDDQKDRKLPKGDPNFHSIGYHNGFRRSRRDDMESLGYCLVFMARGSLPWIDPNDKDLSSAKTIRGIGRRMQSTPVEELCEGLSQHFYKYFDLISHYDFKDKPNYEELRQCFRL